MIDKIRIYLAPIPSYDAQPLRPPKPPPSPPSLHLSDTQMIYLKPLGIFRRSKTIIPPPSSSSTF